MKELAHITPSKHPEPEPKQPDNTNKPKPSSRAVERWKETYEAATVASVGIEMGLAVVVGWFIGYSLDNWLGTGPYMMLLWTLCGIAAGFKGLWRVAQQAKKQDEASEAKKDSEESNR